MKIYMFRTVRLSIIRSLFTVHSAMVYVIRVCRQVSCRNRMEMQFHPGPDRKLVYKHVWHTPMLNIQWINSWWLTEEISETCRVHWQNKFVRLVHLFGLIIKGFGTIRSHIKGKCIHNRTPLVNHTVLRHKWRTEWERFSWIKGMWLGP